MDEPVGLDEPAPLVGQALAVLAQEDRITSTYRRALVVEQFLDRHDQGRVADEAERVIASLHEAVEGSKVVAPQRLVDRRFASWADA